MWLASPTHVLAFSRHDSARACKNVVPPNRRGRRECRVKASPAAPVHNKKHGEGTTGSAESSGIPCAMVLTVSFALSLGTGLCCPHRRADRIRATWSQRRETRTTRLRRPRQPRSSGEANTSIASRPAFVTTRPPLFIETRWRNHTSDLQNQSNELFLRNGLDKTRRTSRDLPDGRSEADRQASGRQWRAVMADHWPDDCVSSEHVGDRC